MGESTAKSINAAANAVQQVKAVRDDLTSRRSKLQAQLDELKARNAYVSALPLNREDGKQFVLDCVDDLGREFVKRTRYEEFIETTFAKPQVDYRGFMGRKSQRPVAVADVLAVREDGWSRLNIWPKHFFGGMIENHIPEADALCFFFGEAIKEKLKAHLDEWYPKDLCRRDHDSEFHGHYANATPEELASSIGVRLAEIRANEEKIEKLEQEIRELGDALASIDAPAQ